MFGLFNQTCFPDRYTVVNRKESLIRGLLYLVASTKSKVFLKISVYIFESVNKCVSVCSL